MSLRARAKRVAKQSPANLEIAHLHCTKRSAVQVSSQLTLLAMT